MYKECPSNCQSNDGIKRGFCRKISLLDGSVCNGTCLINDLSCDVICECCDDEIYTGLSCSITRTEYDKRVKLRNELISTYINTTSYDIPSNVNIKSRSIFLSELVKFSDEISIDLIVAIAILIKESIDQAVKIMHQKMSLKNYYTYLICYFTIKQKIISMLRLTSTIRVVQAYLMKLSIVNEHASTISLERFKVTIQSPSSTYDSLI